MEDVDDDRRSIADDSELGGGSRINKDDDDDGGKSHPQEENEELKLGEEAEILSEMVQARFDDRQNPSCCKVRLHMQQSQWKQQQDRRKQQQQQSPSLSSTDNTCNDPVSQVRTLICERKGASGFGSQMHRLGQIHIQAVEFDTKKGRSLSSLSPTVSCRRWVTFNPVLNTNPNSTLTLTQP